jgi:biopolymer transport protein TolQ
MTKDYFFKSRKLKLTQLNVLDILRQASPITQVVLAILLIFSIGSWGIIFSKALLFRKINKESETFWKIFRRGKSASEVSTACEALRFTPLVPVFNAAFERPSASVAALQRTVQRASTSQMGRLERRMNFLATTASVAPFIGLLGTVLGVMNSFLGLGNANTATLRAVAPGIAEALIATAFGLFAAIPAVIAYNHFLYRLRNVAAELDELQVEMLASAERTAG